MAKSNFPKNRVQRLLEKARRGVAPMEHDNNTEVALVQAYLGGNEDAGMELVERYMDFFSTIVSRPTDVPYKSPAMQQLWSEPSREDYEDLFQEILLHFFIMVREYDPETAPLASYIGSVLKQRVFNNFFSEFLSIKNNEATDFDDVTEKELFHDIDVPKDHIPADYLELYNAMNQLSPRQRSVVELSVINGWNSTEISEEIGIEAKTVRVHLKRGLDRLKTIMGADEDGEKAV